MKQLLLIVIWTLCLVACKKDKNTSGNSASDHYVKFKANGQPIKYEGLYSTQTSTGVMALQRGYPNATIRELTIEGIGDTNNSANFMIGSVDSIRAGQTITLTSASGYGAFVFFSNGKQFQTYSAQIAPQYTITVHIDKHSEGWITGTFSGKIGYQQNLGASFEEITITEGSFQSKVAYYIF